MDTVPMEARLHVEMLPQPDPLTCGPTALHAVYRYYGDDIPLDQVVSQIPMLESGGIRDRRYLAVFGLSRNLTGISSRSGDVWRGAEFAIILLIWSFVYFFLGGNLPANRHFIAVTLFNFGKLQRWSPPDSKGENIWTNYKYSM